MPDTALEQYVEYRIGREKYAIRISEVQEIIKMQAITDIPNSLEYVRGIINLRGKVVPVISQRLLFGMQADEVDKSTRIIVVNHRDEAIGIIVDQVIRVSTYADIQPPPDRLGDIQGANFLGIGLSSEGLVGILRLDQVLTKEPEEA